MAFGRSAGFKLLKIGNLGNPSGKTIRELMDTNYPN
jgi:hypothetical protein